jgi:hypothetical protein
MPASLDLQRPLQVFIHQEVTSADITSGNQIEHDIVAGEIVEDVRKCDIFGKTHEIFSGMMACWAS